jgi:hypothetical protein
VNLTEKSDDAVELQHKIDDVCQAYPQSVTPEAQAEINALRGE